jgi:hypothetical protein
MTWNANANNVPQEDVREVLEASFGGEQPPPNPMVKQQSDAVMEAIEDLVEAVKVDEDDKVSVSVTGTGTGTGAQRVSIEIQTTPLTAEEKATKATQPKKEKKARSSKKSK